MLGTVTVFAFVAALKMSRLTVHGSGVSTAGVIVLEYKTAPVMLIILTSKLPADVTSAIPNVDKNGGGRF